MNQNSYQLLPIFGFLAVLAIFHCLIYQYQCPNGHKITAYVFINVLHSICMTLHTLTAGLNSWEYADQEDGEVGEPAEVEEPAEPGPAEGPASVQEEIDED